VATDQWKLTTDRLIRKGYFPLELPPPFNTSALADSLGYLPDLKTLSPKSSKSIFFSIPKSWPARRVLSVPNPLHQTMLCQTLSDHWPSLKKIFEESAVSLSTPTIFEDGIRAVSRRADFDVWSVERFRRSSPFRFVLRTDLSRFYHTIYTHSLPWAIHGKDSAKQDHSPNLFGNVIDIRMRNTQDQQTIGIPVGPDTSFIMAEVIAARIDQDLEEEIGNLNGTRYVDDFHLYFDTRADAEAAYEALERITKKYELELNQSKTVISEGPDTGEPIWKTALKAQRLRGSGNGQQSSLISFISKTFELVKAFPGEGVLAYAIKKAATRTFDDDASPIFESFLLAALVHDASTLPVVTRLLFDRKTAGLISIEANILETLSRLSLFHAKLRHHYEVSWLLWLFKVLSAKVPSEVLTEIAQLEDSFVALVALDLLTSGLADGADLSLWKALMTGGSLYAEHWLVAYEAAKKGWLPMLDKDYISSDPFFGALALNDVSFYKELEGSGVDYVTLGVPY